MFKQQSDFIGALQNKIFYHASALEFHTILILKINYYFLLLEYKHTAFSQATFQFLTHQAKSHLQTRRIFPKEEGKKKIYI